MLLLDPLPKVPAKISTFSDIFCTCYVQPLAASVYGRQLMAWKKEAS